MSSTDTAMTGLSPQASDEELTPGTIVENFQIECQLGRGGMSTVYGAVHSVIGKRGAVKVLKRELCTDQKEVERFVQEARAVNQIGHANIVDVFAFGVLPDGRSYLIMEWLVGQSLRNRMRRGQLSRNEVRDITLDIVRALEAAHAKGIIHRDLKPDNVFLVESPGERPRAKLLDFGVAKLTGEGRLDRTRVGSMLGTPQYLAPEQARGEAVLASDVYALGVMIFELAAGRPPFVGENSVEVVAMHMTEPPPKLSMLVGGVTPEFDALIEAMLAKDPADRPSLARVRAEMEALGKPMLRTASRTVSTRKRSRTPFVIAGLVGALAMVIAFFAIRAGTSDARDDKPPPHQPAPPPKQPAPKPEPVKIVEPPPAKVIEKGTLVIELKGKPAPKLSIEGKAVAANEPIELEPGTYTLEIQRGRKTEKHPFTITAGQSTKVPIKAATRAPSTSNDDSLNPLNNGTR